jgi:hypothetical protein
VRVVLSLREPGDRCWSWFRFVKSRMRIPKELGFDDYLDRCEQLHRAPGSTRGSRTRRTGASEEAATRSGSTTGSTSSANRTEQYRNRTVQRTAVAVNRRGERFFRRYPRLERGMRSLYFGVNGPASGQPMSLASRHRPDRFFQPYHSRLATKLARLGPPPRRLGLTWQWSVAGCTVPHVRDVPRPGRP